MNCILLGWRGTCKYKKLVKRCKLEDYVLLYGRKTGDNLDYIYDSMDIALGSFVSYKNIYRSSALKIREYLAKGIPVVSGCCEDAFEQDEQYKYYLELPNDSIIVDIQLIINFYNDIYETGMEWVQIRREIREYAKRKVDLSITMMPITEYVNS